MLPTTVFKVAPISASPRVTLWLVRSTLASAVRTIYRLDLQPLTVLPKDCGTAIANGGAPTPPGDCSMVCTGNSSEFCGGPNRLNVYNYTGTDLPSIIIPPVNGGGGNGPPVFPVLSDLQVGWSYNACWV